MKNTKQTKCITFNIELTTAQFNKLDKESTEKLKLDVEKMVLQEIINRFTTKTRFPSSLDYKTDYEDF